MANVYQQVNSANQVICQNILILKDRRDLMSQNILAQIRNLVEGFAVRLYKGDWNAEFSYADIQNAILSTGATSKTNFIPKFHSLIQKIASHFTFDGDNSERLMLKYYEYLLRIKSVALSETGMLILENIEKFPLDLDPSLVEYHQKIAEKIDFNGDNREKKAHRYYIHKIIPFFVGSNIYYEVTFYRATNRSNKSDRIIAFTNLDINDRHSVFLTLTNDSIDVLGRRMPIIIIRQWSVSIRPCEIENFAKLLGKKTSVKTQSTEYLHIMNCLSFSVDSFLEFALMTEHRYYAIKNHINLDQDKLSIFPIIDIVRNIVKNRLPGGNILRYLMLNMRNNDIKLQYSRDTCNRLSNLNLQFASIPFEEMPLCTSLYGHNPKFYDLIDCIDMSKRHHELFARKIKNNVENNGIIYTPAKDCEAYGDVAKLIVEHNAKIYYKHMEQRKIVQDKGHIFISGYENDTVSIINKIKDLAKVGIAGYRGSVEFWLNEAERGIDDQLKITALKNLFSNSHVALIYGAAGTGKSTLLNHVASYFNGKSKLFLAHTNPAKDNLQRKINAQLSDFSTIRSQLSRNKIQRTYDILIIDECSTVCNADMLNILNKIDFKLLILVGDVYQIESIQFGNWFSLIKSFIKQTAVFELETPYRTKNAALLSLWDKVRKNSDDIAEAITQNNYSAPLDKTIFKPQSHDEIVLCLNYDGLYGINNVNRFLQSSNVNPAVQWQESAYKVGDPILFTEAERFRPVIYNNLKGWIKKIELNEEFIQFDVLLDRPLSEFDTLDVDDIEWIEDSTVRFKVFDLPNSSDEDDDSYNTNIPFQVAYAVSIHKAQGIEYDSVKIVITDSNEEDITHSIFYTAITRARNNLKIFWSPETQQSILKRLTVKVNNKDAHLLKSRHANLI